MKSTIYTEWTRPCTYMSTNLVSLAVFAPALDLARPGVLPWVVKLAP